MGRDEDEESVGKGEGETALEDYIEEANLAKSVTNRTACTDPKDKNAIPNFPHRFQLKDNSMNVVAH